MNERKDKMKKVDLDSKKINEQAKKLQQKCVEDIYNNDVYITHFFEIEILEKLNYETKYKEWTEEEQKQIQKIKSKIDDAIIEAYKKAHDWYNFDEQDNQITTYNPKSKWDWYSLGGRWEGTLKLKDGVKPIKESEKSWCNIDKVSEDGYTDFAQVKDIDFSPNMKDKKHLERFWDVNILGKPLLSGEKEEDFYSFYNSNYYKNQYGSKKEYVRCQTEFMTYALLYNGVWYEPSEMGWFGCTDANKNDYQQYREFFRKTINSLSPEDYIAVVDCHI